LTSPDALKNQSSSSSNSKPKTNKNNIQRKKSIQRRQRGKMRLINQENTVSKMEKAQTELKRIKREIEAFEEIKIGMSDLKHIILI
jgi:hypothetical protein